MQNSNRRLSELNQALKAVSTGENVELVKEIESGISEAVKKIKNGALASVTSAVAFNEDEKNRMERYISDNFHKKIIIEYRHDTKILGGFKIAIGDWYLDGTLLAQIEEIKNLFGSARNG